jgi:hypothetical protein
MQWSGNAAITATFGGQSQLNTIYENITAASATVAESTSFLNMTSATGAASGNGPTSAYKMVQAMNINCNAGSANCYGQNIILNLNSGLGAFQGSGQEIDINNLNHDYPVSSPYGGIYSWGLSILTDSTYEVTAGIILGTINNTHGMHDGIWVNTNVVGDNVIEDTGNSATEYYDHGTHATAAFLESSVSPYGWLSNGTYTGAALQDGSTAPYGLVLVGTYSTAALATTGAIILQTGASLAYVTLPSGTAATYACFTSAHVLISSAAPC